MDQVYKFASEHAYADPRRELEVCDIKKAFKIIGPEYMGEGFNTRVFITRDKKWVIKEGRWDLDLDMFTYSGFKIPKIFAGILMEIFNREFVPREDVVTAQFADYQMFLSYLGYTKRDITDNAVHQRQHQIRQHLPISLKNINRRFRLRLTQELIEKLVELRFENFLPKEFLLYGESVSKENDLRKTYYIVQEYIKGYLFHDTKIKQLDEEVLLKLILLACLILIMFSETGKIPDMRPRYIVNEPMSWFTRTDNIILTQDKVYFVDTRLLWDTNRGPIKRGLIIPRMTKRSCKAFIRSSVRLIS